MPASHAYGETAASQDMSDASSPSSTGASAGSLSSRCVSPIPKSSSVISRDESEVTEDNFFNTHTILEGADGIIITRKVNGDAFANSGGASDDSGNGELIVGGDNQRRLVIVEEGEVSEQPVIPEKAQTKSLLSRVLQRQNANMGTSGSGAVNNINLTSDSVFESGVAQGVVLPNKGAKKRKVQIQLA